MLTLEMGLHRRDVTHYAVDMRFAHPHSDANVRLVRGSDLPHTRFDDKFRFIVNKDKPLL